MGTYMIYRDIAEVSMFDCQVTMTTKFLFKVNFDVLTGKYIYICIHHKWEIYGIVFLFFAWVALLSKSKQLFWYVNELFAQCHVFG